MPRTPAAARSAAEPAPAPVSAAEDRGLWVVCANDAITRFPTADSIEVSEHGTLVVCEGNARIAAFGPGWRMCARPREILQAYEVECADAGGAA